MTIQEDEKFICIAIEESKNAKGLKKFGAVVVKDGKLVAKAFNSVYEEADHTKHAEINAISKAAQILKNRRLDGCILYSTCEPCMMCTGAALWAKINEIVFSMSREDAAFNDSSKWHMSIEEIVPDGVIIRSGILKEEARKVLLENG